MNEIAATRILNVQDLGLMEYQSALALQKAAVASVRSAAATDQLLLVEHPAVYTLGRKGQRLELGQGSGPEPSQDPSPEPNSEASKASSPDRVDLVYVERGGEATYHNPGQLVAYPILKLDDSERDVNRYLRNLERVLIELLGDYGIKAESRTDATGVWLVGRDKKIASIGVALTSWVTYHGIALNVTNDLSGFARIQPCGFAPSVMTSLKQELGAACPALADIKTSFVNLFCQVFNRRCQ
jgi:lipoyl(octanoyl) transferase